MPGVTPEEGRKLYIVFHMPIPPGHGVVFWRCIGRGKDDNDP